MKMEAKYKQQEKKKIRIEKRVLKCFSLNVFKMPVPFWCQYSIYLTNDTAVNPFKKNSQSQIKD